MTTLEQRRATVMDTIARAEARQRDLAASVTDLAHEQAALEAELPARRAAVADLRTIERALEEDRRFVDDLLAWFVGTGEVTREIARRTREAADAVLHDRPRLRELGAEVLALHRSRFLRLVGEALGADVVPRWRLELADVKADRLENEVAALAGALRSSRKELPPPPASAAAARGAGTPTPTRGDASPELP